MTAAADRPELKHLFEIITSIKGISEVTATEIIITTNEFKDIKDPKKLGCYAGCVPFEKSSGKKNGKPRVSSIANKKNEIITSYGSSVGDSTL